MGKQKVFRTGNSLAITVPSRVVQSWGVKPGDEVEVVAKGNRLVCVFSGSKQLWLGEEFVKKSRIKSQKSKLQFKK